MAGFESARLAFAAVRLYRFLFLVNVGVGAAPTISSSTRSNGRSGSYNYVRLPDAIGASANIASLRIGGFVQFPGTARTEISDRPNCTIFR